MSHASRERGPIRPPRGERGEPDAGGVIWILVAVLAAWSAYTVLTWWLA